jgi:hypothetical protein
LIFGPFSEWPWISQPNVQFDGKVDLGIDRYEYEDFFLTFYEVWSHLEGTDMKIVQADACPEILANFGTPCIFTSACKFPESRAGCPISG